MTQKMLYFHLAPIPSQKANAVQVVSTCSALQRAGVDIELVCIRNGASPEKIFEDYDVAPFPLTPLSFGNSRYISSTVFRTWAAFRMLQSNAVIYTRDVGTAYVAAILGQAFAYELHALPYKPAQKSMLRKILRSPFLKSIVSISRGLENDLLNTYGPIPLERRAIIPCAAAPVTNSFQSSVKERLQVGYVGHFYAGKGGDLFRALADCHPEMDFHVVGNIEDPALLGTVPPNLIRHGAKVHSAAMEQLNHFDIVLAPYSLDATDGKVNLSRWFSPLKLFEYMAHGKPIVCSDLEVIREILTNDESALLVDPTSLDSWSGALTRLRRDADLRARLAHRGLELIREHYSYEKRATQIIAATADPQI